MRAAIYFAKKKVLIFNDFEAKEAVKSGAAELVEGVEVVGGAGGYDYLFDDDFSVYVDGRWGCCYGCEGGVRQLDENSMSRFRTSEGLAY